VRGRDLDATLDAFVAITMVARDVADGIARMGDFLCLADRALNRRRVSQKWQISAMGAAHQHGYPPTEQVERERSAQVMATDDEYGKEQ
jgi:hypothetical protein